VRQRALPRRKWADNEGQTLKETPVPKGQERSNREKKKPKKQEPVRPATPGRRDPFDKFRPK
jgi:hypothetical protein